MRLILLLLALGGSALAQVDETRVDAWFHGCKVTSADLGLHNGGVAKDVLANWGTSPTTNQVYVKLQNNSAIYSTLSARASAQGVTIPTALSHTSLIFDGESTTAGDQSTQVNGANNDYPSQLMRRANWVGKGIRYNVGVTASTIAAGNARYATNVTPRKPNGTTITAGWYFCWFGVNDINSGRTAASTFADLEALWLRAKAEGYTVVAFTINNLSTWDAGKKAEAAALNVLILASATPDHAIDVVEAIGQPPSANFGDNIHPNNTGYGLLADEANNVITP